MTEMYRKKLPPAIQFWRLSVGQYERMIDAGILTDDDPVELLEGCLIKKLPRNPSHRLVTRRVRDSVERLLPSGWYFDSQEPMVTADSDPTGPADEPDYQQHRDYGPTQAWPLLLDGQEIGVLAVRDLLP